MTHRLTSLIIITFMLFTLAVPACAGAAPPRWFQPIMALPSPVIQTFRCVIEHESTSTFAHPNLGDNDRFGSSGIFQIEEGTWAAHQAAAHVPYSVHVWQATPYQQAKVAVAIWRADGWGPWSRDGCF